MNTDKQRIYNGDWKTLHPYSGSAPTDLYYISTFSTFIIYTQIV